MPQKCTELIRLAEEFTTAQDLESDSLGVASGYERVMVGEVDYHELVLQYQDRLDNEDFVAAMLNLTAAGKTQSAPTSYSASGFSTFKDGSLTLVLPTVIAWTKARDAKKNFAFIFFFEVADKVSCHKCCLTPSSCTSSRALQTRSWWYKS